MAFKVRAKRLGPGSYWLEFGKGGNKITGTATGSGKGWVLRIDGSSPATGFAAFADAKQYFGEYARAGYKGKLSDAERPEPYDAGDEHSAEDLDDPQPFGSMVEVISDADLAADGPDDPAKPMTAHDALRLVLDWARRQHRDIRVPPFADCVRVLEREGGEYV